MDRELGESFVAALGARDWHQLESLLAPDVRFRALLPSSLREAEGAAGAVALFRTWLGDSTEVELESSRVGEVEDRLQLAWRLRAVKDGTPHLVEQQAFATVEAGKIADLALVCSGFRERESAGRS